MNVQELIEQLEAVEDKTLPINIVNVDSEDEENIWAGEIEVSDTGSSGYEVEGEVRILGSE